MSLVPQALGGWWHDYVCPTHDVELARSPEGDHRCPRGCVVVGEKIDAAALVLDHQAAARTVRLLAHRAARTGDVAAREQAVAMLGEYADVYDEAVSSGWSGASESWMLRGKLFAQALTEAQWAVQVADAVIVLGADGLAPGVPTMLRSLLETVDDARTVLVDERDDARSNYTAWLDAAGALLARALVVCGEPVHAGLWVERTLDHLDLAVGDDGWEWEGSTYYHLFVLRAYLLALRDVKPTDLPQASVEALAAMVRVLAEVAAPDGRLPSLHDGPYDRAPMHREVLEIAALSRGLLTPTGLDTVERYARERLGVDDDGLELGLDGWFAGPPVPTKAPTRGSVLFPDVGYAVLRDGRDRLQAVLDAGPHGGAHGHLDKLAVYLYGADAWQPAPGVPPYASRLRRGHYARTVAHPTVRVDGYDQRETSGQILEWDAARGRVTASAEPFVGVRVRRSLVMGDGVLADVVTVTCTDGVPHDISLGLRPAVGLDVRTVPQGAVSTWQGDGARLHGVHVSSVPAVMQAGPGRGPSHDPAAPQHVADWTVHAERVVLASLYVLDDQEPDVSVTFAPAGTTTFHLRARDGATTIEVTP
ncbi:heparinase II/III domain-containing protein [Paraoerskovia marina]|uniref:heparinase II/III domain-containing protein n=1 Tax=Paraoerskovia marina TaxID=545619 RepID=UPI000492785F|nr:heparinase II/III family protein [Paraoerskovia marina]